MNKYIFPIIKWKIKSWLKYYILNKSATSYPLSEIIEGTSPLTLENSIRKKFHIFKVKGNTVQNGEPTPETPIPVENVSGEVEVKVANGTDSTATGYEEQTATFPLAEGQVLHLGDTLEDDGIHQTKYTKVFDGNEQITRIIEWGNYYRAQLLISNAKIYSTNVQHNQLCSHFNYNDTGVFDINAEIKVGMFAQYRSTNNFYFMTDKTSVNNFKSWLTEQYTNGTPVTLECELATPITIPYTAEQQTAYNSLKNLYSYKGTTYISSTNEPSPVFEVQYYMKEGEV